MEPTVARFERRLRIRFSHCDPAGIVFYPQYFVLFNGLVEDWISEELGIPYADLIGRSRVGLPTVSIACTFSAVSRMGDDIALGLTVERLGSRSMTLCLDCRGQGSDEAPSLLRVHTRNVLVTTDLETHRAIPIPSELREAILRFSSAG